MVSALGGKQTSSPLGTNDCFAAVAVVRRWSFGSRSVPLRSFGLSDLVKRGDGWRAEAVDVLCIDLSGSAGMLTAAQLWAFSECVESSVGVVELMACKNRRMPAPSRVDQLTFRT